MRIAAVIVAAGRGLRAGTGVPKQFRPLAGRPVLAHSVGAFAAHRAVAELVVVAHPDDAERAAAACGVAAPHRVAGGATRAASVAAGLAALGPGITHVLIHDAARPCVPVALIDRVVAGLATSPGAAPALPVSDALWQARGGSVLAAHPRAGLFAAQTPQGFELAAIRAAHAAHPGGAADDVEVALAHGLDVALVAGEPDALKITRPDDFARAERALGGGGMDIRTGNGIDVHAFGEGDHVTLCGVDIPHDRGLVGHSDADVAMHALTDALYGALAEGDIGRHFPPTDPQWRHAASHVFLDHAAARAAARGYRLASADITLICEAPKIAPHTDAMTATLARCTGAGAGRIAVKATTSEGLGFPGRGEGIAALATVTLLAP